MPSDPSRSVGQALDRSRSVGRYIYQSIYSDKRISDSARLYIDMRINPYRYGYADRVSEASPARALSGEQAREGTGVARPGAVRALLARSRTA